MDISPPFHKYLFLDNSTKYIQELNKIRTDYPQLDHRIRIEKAEANTFLIDWCNHMDWSKNRAVVFLDPYGMQVEWKLLEALAATKAVDLWLLFPLGMGVNRLLTRNKRPSDSWAKALTRIFGTDDWQSFYQTDQQLSLFSQEEVECKTANFQEIGRFFVKQLKSIFADAIDEPLQLCNSRNNPLYLLCFAAANEHSAKTAIKIAGDIIEKSRRR